jgi:hypothetical protein
LCFDRARDPKNAVAKPGARKFLGFSFTSGKQPRRRIAPQAIARFKSRVQELTRRTGGQSLSQVAKELSVYLIGWRGYFGFCETRRKPIVGIACCCARAPNRPRHRSRKSRNELAPFHGATP